VIYGNKFYLVILFLSFFLIVGCANKNFYFELYDGYTIRNIDDDVKLYKDLELFEINDLDYEIKEFKYNSDVVCLKLSNDTYYMIYYVDGTVYGPFDKNSLDISINNLSMTFDNEFTNIFEKEGLIYE